jgi:hypothetical protein
MTNLIFKDSSLFEQVKRSGFAVIDFADAETIGCAYQTEQLFIDRNSNPHSHFDSLTTDDVLLTRLVHTQLMEVFEANLERVFRSFKVPIAMMLTKLPSVNSGIGMHQDPSLLRHEDCEHHLGIWIPLVDTDQTNGSMRVIEGSHVLLPPVQALSLPPALGGISQESERFAKPINLRTGQALVFDNRILHSSLPNRSSAIRTAAIIRITASDAQFISFHFDEQRQEVVVVRQPEDFYTAHSYKEFRSSFPGDERVAERFPFVPRLLTIEEFEHQLHA